MPRKTIVSMVALAAAASATALVARGGGGETFFLSEHPPSATSTAGSSPNNEASPSEVSSEDWELYSDSGGATHEAFSFRYPPAWHLLSHPVSPDATSKSVTIRSHLPTGSCDETQSWDDCATDYKLEVFAFKEGARSNWAIDQRGTQRSDVTVGGVPATLHTVDQNPPFPRAYGVAVEHNGFVYTLWLYSSLADPDDSLASQIIGSFRFLGE